MNNKRQSQLEAVKRYRKKHRKELNEYAKLRMRKLWEENPELVRKKQREYRQAVRERTILAYGGKCKCCGETELKFLSFDHIDGGGSKERKRLCSASFCFPVRKTTRKDIQILCHNCNQAKGFYGKCPHKK
jgi:5-methylcytosine-specific restriction endonuclease McrA